VANPALAAVPRHGRVTSFDARRGLGTVTDDDAGEFGFHATAVADGSRRIGEGTAVIFAVVPGNGGRYEARSLVPEGAARPTCASHHTPA
jgi:cold shock CspA family protein